MKKHFWFRLVRASDIRLPYLPIKSRRGWLTLLQAPAVKVREQERKKEPAGQREQMGARIAAA
jgi:hypothetical protein